MRARRHLAAALLAVAGALAVPVRADVVERRGAEPTLEGTVTGIDDAGVYVRNELGASHCVPWDRVRRVLMERVEPDLARRMATATDLWRARSRLERGDFALAEPRFERLFEQYRGQTHETALVVAEGLLRCRLSRGDNAGAVIPALETARLRRAGVETRSYAGLAPAIDEATALCPQVAPAWVDSGALVRLERDLDPYDSGGDAVIADIARWYRAAARRQLGLVDVGDAEAETGAPSHPGPRLLQMVVACSDPGIRERGDARRRLEARLDEYDPWVEGWARFALGASLVRESGVGRRQRGLVQLLHVPARWERRQPYLAGLALAWVAEVSRAMEDDRTASIALAELARRYPNHPLHDETHPVRLPRIEDPT